MPENSVPEPKHISNRHLALILFLSCCSLIGAIWFMKIAGMFQVLWAGPMPVDHATLARARHSQEFPQTYVVVESARVEDTGIVQDEGLPGGRSRRTIRVKYLALPVEDRFLVIRVLADDPVREQYVGSLEPSPIELDMAISDRNIKRLSDDLALRPITDPRPPQKGDWSSRHLPFILDATGVDNRLAYVWMGMLLCGFAVWVFFLLKLITRCRSLVTAKPNPSQELCYQCGQRLEADEMASRVCHRCRM